MKQILFLFLCFFGAKLQAQENYVLQLNGKDFSLAIDSIYEISLEGKKINFLLKQKDTLAFNDGLFSFSYFKGYQVSKTNVDNIADQYIVVDAGGSGFMMQKYGSINPSSMKEFLLQEITKESKGYGYKEKREEFKKTLLSGQVVTVIKSTLTYKDDINIYEVATIAGKDEGLVIITLDMGGEVAQKGRELSKLMWHSIRYNGKVAN
jgi:hypothetical protein